MHSSTSASTVPVVPAGACTKFSSTCLSRAIGSDFILDGFALVGFLGMVLRLSDFSAEKDFYGSLLGHHECGDAIFRPTSTPRSTPRSTSRIRLLIVPY